MFTSHWSLFSDMRRFADLPAWICGGDSRSYAGLEADSATLAEQLRMRGLREGERLAVYAANSPLYLTLYPAAWRLGVTLVALNTRLPAKQISQQLALLDCRLLIAPSSVSVPGFAGICCPEEELFAAMMHPSSVRPAPLLQLNAAADIMFTSGSSGPPKAALHTIGNHYFSALGSNRNIPLKPGHRWLLSLPLYHVGGLGILLRCLLAGAAVVIPGRDEATEDNLNRQSITHLSLVSTQLLRLLGHTPQRLQSLQALLLGGSAIPQPLLEQCRELQLPLFTSYGSTEMSSQIATTAAGDNLQSSGRLLAYRELCIAGNGEILVRGKTLFRGYVDAQGLDAARDEQGWFHTRDLGSLDSDGNLFVRGRLDNMFISGGENIQPEQIERALLTLPGILRAVVVPQPDSEFGFRPLAFLDTGEQPLPTLAAVQKNLRRDLPGYMLPQRLLALPADAGDLKTDRRELIKLAAQAIR